MDGHSLCSLSVQNSSLVLVTQEQREGKAVLCLSFLTLREDVSNVYQTLTVCDDSEQLKEHLDMCKVPVAYEGLRRHLSKSNQTQCD